MGKTKSALRVLVGTVAELTMPHLGRELDDARNPERAPKLKRAILLARLQRAERLGDAAAVERALAAFWRGEAGDRFHGEYAQERFALFRTHHAGVIDALHSFVQTSGVGLDRLVEIGCGDGSVLAYCADVLPWVKSAIGLDVNATVIAQASARQPPASRLSFACAEARDWLTANPQAGTVVLSNGGVLEYFSQENFDRLLQALALASPAALVLVEPLADDHDLERRAGSYTFGKESSFSHNHRARLNQAGFEVVFEQPTQFEETRAVMMIGVLK